MVFYYDMRAEQAVFIRYGGKCTGVPSGHSVRKIFPFPVYFCRLFGMGWLCMVYLYLFCAPVFLIRKAMTYEDLVIFTIHPYSTNIGYAT
jgi:hypothetical protein